VISEKVFHPEHDANFSKRKEREKEPKLLSVVFTQYQKMKNFACGKRQIHKVTHTPPKRSGCDLSFKPQGFGVEREKRKIDMTLN